MRDRERAVENINTRVQQLHEFTKHKDENQGNRCLLCEETHALPDASNRELEVTGLRHRRQDGVVGCRAAPIEQLKNPPRTSRTCNQDVEENFRLNVVRAGSREENPPLVQYPEGACMEFLVSLFGGLNILPALRKGRRIEDNNIEHSSLVGESLQGIEHISLLEPDVGKGVQCRVLFRSTNGFRRNVNAENGPRAAVRGMERKSPVVAKAIQHLRIPAEPPEKMAVLPLIEKEPCLLSFQQIHDERDSIIIKDGGSDRSTQHAFLQRKLFEFSKGRLVSLDDSFRLKKGFESIADHFRAAIHAVGKSLDREILIVLINDKSREEITFAVHQTERFTRRIEPASQRERRGDSLYKKLCRDLLRLVGKKPERDERMRIVQSDTEGLAAGSQQFHNVADGRRAAHLLHFIAEYPRMSGKDPAVFPLLENELFGKMNHTSR